MERLLLPRSQSKDEVAPPPKQKKKKKKDSKDKKMTVEDPENLEQKVKSSKNAVMLLTVYKVGDV